MNIKNSKKTKFSKNTTDDYGSLHLYYDEKNLLSAVEVFAGEKLILNGRDLFKLSLNELKQIFPDAESDSYGFISKKFSVGVSAIENKVETILVGKTNYYQ